MTAKRPRKPAPTPFQRFLVRYAACQDAQAFVAKHGGDFARAWKRCPNSHWKGWLYVTLHDASPSHMGPWLSVWSPLSSATTTRKRNQQVLREARRRRWLQ